MRCASEDSKVVFVGRGSVGLDDLDFICGG